MVPDERRRRRSRRRRDPIGGDLVRRLAPPLILLALLLPAPLSVPLPVTAADAAATAAAADDHDGDDDDGGDDIGGIASYSSSYSAAIAAAEGGGVAAYSSSYSAAVAASERLVFGEENDDGFVVIDTTTKKSTSSDGDVANDGGFDDENGDGYFAEDYFVKDEGGKAWRAAWAGEEGPLEEGEEEFLGMADSQRRAIMLDRMRTNVDANDGGGDGREDASSSSGVVGGEDGPPHSYDGYDNGRVLYDSVFHSTFEEYDFVRFDPYSFSGAPLGGWGRATRSRLATLPIRLVVGSGSGVDGGFGGGLELLFGSGGDGGGGDGAHGGEEEGSRNEENEGDQIEPGEDDDGDSSYQVVRGDDDSPAETSSNEQKTEDAPSSTFDVRRSIGPHFTIYDATGQRFVCRTYPEDELIVSSRIDSAFYPAVTVWDEEADAAIDTNVGVSMDEDDASAKVAVDENEFDEEGVVGGVLGGGIANKVKFSLTGIGGDVGNLPENIRAAVSRMLLKLGMADAAEALVAAVNNAAYVEVGLADDAVAAAAADENFDEVVMMIVDDDGVVDGFDHGGGLGGNDNGMVAAGISDIIRAAALGAGIGGSKKENTKDDDNGEKSNARGRSLFSAPPRPTISEIFQLLDSLDGVCAQLHNGNWWSYEWCHQEVVRQFHVAFSNDSPPRAEVHDVSLIGQFDGLTKIIYPKGIYDGKPMEGVITTVRRVHDGDGGGISFKVVDQIASEYNMFDKDLTDDELTDPRKTKLVHERGPVIQHSFINGDYCDDVFHHRIMNVDLICCTEDEIDQWLESKKPRNARKAIDDKVKEKTPQAVLISVKEEETCVYRSRVCTPVLCPRLVPDASETAATHEVTAKTVTTEASAGNAVERRKKDPVGSVFNAIFGNDQIAQQRGELRVYFPNDVTDQEFDELIRQAQEGLDFTKDPSFDRVKMTLLETREGGRIANTKKLSIKSLLKGLNDGTDIDGSPSPIPNVMEVKDGESIRGILDKTLGKRPCLIKNLGWWTYELCHRQQIRQYHVENIIDAATGFPTQTLTSEHVLGVYKGGGNTIEDYPDEDEHLHVVNAALGSPAADLGIGNAKKNDRQQPSMAGGNGAVYEQEYKHGAICDHEDVALSVIKGGNVLKGSVERSSTVRFMCGKQWELIDVKEDSTCHYLLDVTVPELCQHNLFKAPMMKTQVVKCLPV